MTQPHIWGCSWTNLSGVILHHRHFIYTNLWGGYNPWFYHGSTMVLPFPVSSTAPPRVEFPTLEGFPPAPRIVWRFRPSGDLRFAPRSRSHRQLWAFLSLRNHRYIESLWFPQPIIYNGGFSISMSTSSRVIYYIGHSWGAHACTGLIGVYKHHFFHMVRFTWQLFWVHRCSLDHPWPVPGTCLAALAAARWEALTNIDGIIAKSQALMVARGDLGVELGLNRVPFAQKLLIARAKQAGRLFVPGHVWKGFQKGPEMYQFYDFEAIFWEGS